LGITLEEFKEKNKSLLTFDQYIEKNKGRVEATEHETALSILRDGYDGYVSMRYRRYAEPPINLLII
jgi:hypothetical protein